METPNDNNETPNQQPMNNEETPTNIAPMPAEEVKTKKKEAPSFDDADGFPYKRICLVPTSPQKIREGKETWKFPGLGENFTVETLKTILSKPDYLDAFIRSFLNSEIMQKYQAAEGDLEQFKRALDNLFSEESTRTSKIDHMYYLNLAIKYQKEVKALTKSLSLGTIKINGRDVNVREEITRLNNISAEMMAKAQEMMLTQ